MIVGSNQVQLYFQKPNVECDQKNKQVYESLLNYGIKGVLVYEQNNEKNKKVNQKIAIYQHEKTKIDDIPKLVIIKQKGKNVQMSVLQANELLKVSVNNPSVPQNLCQQNTQLCIQTKDRNLLLIQYQNQQMRDLVHESFSFLYQKMLKIRDQKPNLQTEIQNFFNVLDKDKSGKLDINEVHQLLKTLNINLKKHQLKDYMNQIDDNKDQLLDFDEFFNFYLELISKKELIAVFSQYCYMFRKKKENQKKYYKTLMTKSEFTEFMKQEQKEEVDSELMERVFGNQDTISFIEFCMLLFRMDNQIDGKIETDDEYYSHDMRQYWVSSSHNTYLSGNQFTSGSNVINYKKSIELGCRCYEIDCWDDTNGVKVTHGFTFTSSIKFEDVIQTIKQESFDHGSEFPAIISIENHCNSYNQYLMGEIMHNILGEQLFVLDNNNASEIRLNDLKKMFIVKMKVSSQQTNESFSDSESNADFRLQNSQLDSNQMMNTQNDYNQITSNFQTETIQMATNNNQMIDNKYQVEQNQINYEAEYEESEVQINKAMNDEILHTDNDIGDLMYKYIGLVPRLIVHGQVDDDKKTKNKSKVQFEQSQSVKLDGEACQQNDKKQDIISQLCKQQSVSVDRPSEQNQNSQQKVHLKRSVGSFAQEQNTQQQKSGNSQINEQKQRHKSVVRQDTFEQENKAIQSSQQSFGLLTTSQKTQNFKKKKL